MTSVLSVLILYLITYITVAFEFVKFCNNPDSCKVIMLIPNKKLAREVVDKDSKSFLEINEDSLKVVDELNGYTRGDPLPTISRNNWTPDEIIRVELLLLSVLQDSLIKDLLYLGPYVNPSVILFQERFLLATSLQWGVDMGCKGPQNDLVEFRWINHTDFPFIDQNSLYGVPANDSSSLDVPILGQDPRLMAVDQSTFLVAFTNHRYHPVRMGFVLVELSNFTGHLFIREDYHMIFDASIHAQKNWTPFVHNGNVYFVQNISPLRVIKVDEAKNMEKMLYFDKYWNVVKAAIVSEHLDTIQWNYGDIRGGSNAILIAVDGHEPCYISFFHSSRRLTGNSYLTYFFGAYTFTAEMPFKLIGASPYPIVHPELYSGAWAFITSRRIDYVPFPTGLSFRNGTLYLSLGHQDWKGIIARLDASALLDSLVPVGTT